MRSIRNFQIYSSSLQVERTVNVFLPPGYRTGLDYPALFCADGQAVEGFSNSLSKAMEEGRTPPVILVGVHSDPRLRAYEYVDGIENSLFLAHEHFFTDEVYRWAIAKLDLSFARPACGIFGFSNGGAFALSMGIRHPEKYGVVIAFSIAGGAHRIKASEYARRPAARYYLSAGTREKPFRDTSRAVARILSKSNVEHVITERYAGHDFDFWNSELCEAIRWAFPEDELGNC
ncbi:MAG: hypothetical protein KDB01_23950 [Planctomycetaceae bacterium]|nr:hypothetical protein [Planctomycetaceae bacterium]